MTGLAGKVALVTGSARRRGIGRGIALALADAGCNVAVNDVSAEDEAEELVALLAAEGVRSGFYRADVSDRREVEAMLDELESELGPVDIACSNAGIAAWEPVDRIEPATLEAVIGVNLTGAFNVGQASARRMVARGAAGRILFTSSVHVQMPFPEMAVYGATKQAMATLAEVMAVELASFGITVNHLGPGWVMSDLNDDSPSLQTDDDMRATLAMIPAGRPGEPGEIGKAAAYLCSDDAAYVTGAFLRVDGGFVVGKY